MTRPLPLPLRPCPALLLACAALLSACGGGGGSSDTGTGTGGGSGGSSGPPASTVASPCGTSGRSSANYGSSVYLIDPSRSATLPAGATRVASFDGVPWSTLPAGSTVLVAAGTYAQTVTIGGTGTSAAPIVVQAADSANLPVITGSVDVRGASYVQISRLTVQMDAGDATSADYPGFTIREDSNHVGSSHVTVADSQVVNAFTGFDITSGTGHQIQCNTVKNSYANGLGLEANATPADPTVISYNTVTDSGTHGMELHASYHSIVHNIVSGSGRLNSGSSGIHIYADYEGDAAGAGNTVRYNYSYGNHDTTKHDGNGIQIDQWCDHNEVSFNVAWGNDGAGINLFDANNNSVFANTLYGNGVNTGGTHGTLGELIVNGSGDYADRPTGNTIYDNIAVATHTGVAAINVDQWSSVLYNQTGYTASSFGPNLFYGGGSGVLAVWNGVTVASGSASTINSATGTSGNVVEMPAFYDTSHPLANGLWLTAHPSGGSGASNSLPDMLGLSGGSGWSYFGAYFTAP